MLSLWVLNMAPGSGRKPVPGLPSTLMFRGSFTPGRGRKFWTAEEMGAGRGDRGRNSGYRDGDMFLKPLPEGPPERSRKDLQNVPGPAGSGASINVAWRAASGLMLFPIVGCSQPMASGRQWLERASRRHCPPLSVPRYLANTLLACLRTYRQKSGLMPPSLSGGMLHRFATRRCTLRTAKQNEPLHSVCGLVRRPATRS